MRNRKKTITTLLTAAILLIAVFAAGRYGWKLLGFRACEEAGIESVEVSETTVTVKGFCPAHGAQGVHAHEVAHHQGIHRVVHLLEEGAKGDWQEEEQDLLPDDAGEKGVFLCALLFHVDLPFR